MKKVYLLLLCNVCMLVAYSQNCIRVTSASFSNPSNDGITWKLVINYNADGNKTLETAIKLGQLTLINDCFNASGTGTKEYDNIIAVGGNLLLNAVFVPRTGSCGSAQCGPIQVLAPGGLLPIVLNTFDVKRIQQSVQLNWSTMTETNSALFVIEKSNDTKFDAIGTVNAVGFSSTNQQYTYTDKTFDRNTSYYRLKLVDRDGSFTYSPIKKVAASNGGDEVNIYPNPIYSNSKVNIEGVQANTLIEVIDISGKKITQQYLRNQNNFTMPVLQKGFYLLKITEPNSSNSIIKKVNLVQ